MSDEPLVLATQGLVLATAFLVVATAVPAYQRWRENRTRHLASAARVVPDMNILKSRLQASLNLVEGRASLTVPQLDRLHDEARRDQKTVLDLLDDAYAISLKFANEIYILRHLVTSIRHEIVFLTRAAEEATGIESRHQPADKGMSHHHSREHLSEEARIQRIAMLAQCALLTLGEAEQLLPEAGRTVDGQSFWDRFSKTISERETEAEKQLVDRRARRRARSRS